MVTVKPRLMWLRAAAAGIALVTSGLALSAAGNAHAQTIAHAPKTAHTAAVKPRFAIVCSGDACVQTTFKGPSLANINAWANTVSFTGHFDLYNGCGEFMGHSPDQFWPSGRDPFPFRNLHWADCFDHWKVIAWQKNAPNNYSNIGTVNFSI